MSANRKTAASFIDPQGGRADNGAEEITGTTPRLSGTRRAAQSALDVMLTDAAVDRGNVGRFIQPIASAKVAAKLALHPNRAARRAGDLGRGLAAAASGRSTVAPAKRDRRFGGRG